MELKGLKSGDIVWCNRVFDGQDHKLGDKEGPYIYIGDTNATVFGRNIIAVNSKSKISMTKEEIDNFHGLVLNSENSCLEQEYYFDFGDLVAVPYSYLEYFKGVANVNDYIDMNKEILNEKNVGISRVRVSKNKEVIK